MKPFCRICPSEGPACPVPVELHDGEWPLRPLDFWPRREYVSGGGGQGYAWRVARRWEERDGRARRRVALRRERHGGPFLTGLQRPGTADPAPRKRAEETAALLVRLSRLLRSAASPRPPGHAVSSPDFMDLRKRG